jgi:hypothetical protein
MDYLVADNVLIVVRTPIGSVAFVEHFPAVNRAPHDGTRHPISDHRIE